MRGVARLGEALAAFLVVLLGGLLALRRFNDFDVFWHLRTGDWILSEGRVPTADPFGAVTGGEPWLDVAWGAQVLMSLVARVAGLGGVHLCAVAIVIASLALVLIRVRTPLALVACLLFVLSAWPRFLVRPDLLLLPLTLLLAHLIERLPSAPRSTAALLGVLSVCWANLHGSFVLAPVALALAAAAVAIPRPAPRPALAPYLVALLAACAATLVNPAGLRIYAVLAPYARSALAALGLRPPVERLAISEWTPIWRTIGENPAFPTWPLLLLVALTAGSFARRGRELSCPRLLFVAALGLLAAAATRNVLPFAAAALASVALDERDRVAARSASRPSARRAAPALRALVAGAVSLVAAAQCVWVVTDRFYVARDLPHRTGVGCDVELLPEGAVRWMAANLPFGLTFNNFDSGAYLLYRLYPHFRPYTDARVVDADFFTRTQRAVQQPGRFQSLVAEQGIGNVLLVHPSPESFTLLPRLAADPSWGLVFRDHNSTIHARTDLPAPVARERSWELAPVHDPVAARLDELLRPLKRHTLPAAELTDAFISGLIGDRARELDAYRAALRRAPGNRRAMAYFEARRPVATD